MKFSLHHAHEKVLTYENNGIFVYNTNYNGFVFLGSFIKLQNITKSLRYTAIS